MNIEKSIRTAVDTGKVSFGERETLKALRAGSLKMAIVAANCRPDVKEDALRHAGINNVFVYEYLGSSLELGSICGKPFTISMLTILEAGESDIMELSRR